MEKFVNAPLYVPRSHAQGGLKLACTRSDAITPNNSARVDAASNCQDNFVTSGGSFNDSGGVTDAGGAPHGYKNRKTSGAGERRSSRGAAKSPLYKSEMCRTWTETGTCKYGRKCQFAHGENELTDISRHPKYKTQVCRTYAIDGFCPYGARCRFVHEASSDGSVPSSACTTPEPLISPRRRGRTVQRSVVLSNNAATVVRARELFGAEATFCSGATSRAQSAALHQGIQSEARGRPLQRSVIPLPPRLKLSACTPESLPTSTPPDSRSPSFCPVPATPPTPPADKHGFNSAARVTFPQHGDNCTAGHHQNLQDGGDCNDSWPTPSLPTLSCRVDNKPSAVKDYDSTLQLPATLESGIAAVWGQAIAVFDSSTLQTPFLGDPSQDPCGSSCPGSGRGPWLGQHTAAVASSGTSTASLFMQGSGGELQQGLARTQSRVLVTGSDVQAPEEMARTLSLAASMRKSLLLAAEQDAREEGVQFDCPV